ncbi:hypothetical protein RHSIM_Rhsim01G0281300 [Rhododendron simsii]|uniref:Glutaredoxin domain-containing protein n=1 Tax=Rhododendron simsii TaxID=118357 RepID=A0A834M2B6_RHOSS|nr:hypothetical protein RHSIM_Rhsim01G0281300 [Rhododendron simsii]
MAKNTNTVMNLGAQGPLVIFSKSDCCMSDSMKILFYDFGANPTIYELDQLQNGKQLERELVALGRGPSVPMVFIGGELVGGPNEVTSLHVRGELVRKLLRARAIHIWNDERRG